MIKKKYKKIILSILLVISIGLILYTPIRNNYLAQKTNKYAVSKVSKRKIEENKKINNDKVSFDWSDVKSISEKELIESLKSGSSLPVIGGIAIPDLNMNLPIFKGVTNEALMYGAGTMKEEQDMGNGNYALASHHVSGFTGASNLLFSPLVNAKEGMLIYLTDKTNIYKYTIKEIKTVLPTDIEVIDDKENETLLTLVTCDDFAAQKRIVVVASLTETIPYDTASDNDLKPFTYKYNTYKFW